jgi:alpha-galactosidase
VVRICRRVRGLSVVLAALTVFAAVVVSALADAPSAHAASGGADRSPVMGWSSWSFLRFGVNTADVEAEAKAM